MSRVIGLAGAMGAGKDTVANYLIDRHSFIRIAFADALKDDVCDRFRRTVIVIGNLNGIAKRDLTDEQYVRWLVWEVKPSGIRQLLQEYGTEVRRKEDGQYWVRAWQKRAAPWVEAGHRVVVPDVRFPNEALAISGLGGKVWEIMRPGLPKDTHSSELPLPIIMVDQFLWNQSTVAALEEQVANAYKLL